MRVAFTVRSDSAASGSYLRYDDDTMGERDDYDSALRADGLQLAPAVFEESFLEATSVCYGEVKLDWGVNLSEPSDLPTVTGTVLVYSTEGQPQTLGGGTILVEDSSSLTYTHTGLPEGRWAYYSLFLHYSTTDLDVDNYFELAASLEVLVPRNYGSTMALWRRIPEFYRQADIDQGTIYVDPCVGVPAGEVVGPLFKYLSIFGFDMDRIRTILDYMMVANDPQEAESEALDMLAEQMDVLGMQSAHFFNQVMTVNDLGTTRLRHVLDDIGFFRRAKGTPASLEYLARALTGGEIFINTGNHSITLYSQRVNYITAPIDGAGIVVSRAADADEVTTPIPSGLT